MISSREAATITLIILIIVMMLFSEKLRKPMLNIVPPFFKLLYHRSMLLIHIYVLAVLIMFEYIKVVDSKNSITYFMWLVTVLYPALMTEFLRKKSEINIKKFLGKTIGITFFLHFIVATYTMNYFIELIFIIFSSLIAVFKKVSSTNSQYDVVRKACERLTILLGLFLIAYSFSKFIINIDDLRDLGFWKVLLIEISVIFHMPLYYYVKFVGDFEKNKILRYKISK